MKKFSLQQLILLFIFFLFPSNQLKAQITPDQTLGQENSVVKPIDQINDRIENGATRGTNLFHSFQEFNIDLGKGVYFANPVGIENILTRVTGSNVSHIFGKLGVEGTANLFLINPNGIFFGNNASLDIRGSFTATTVDGIKLGENGLFTATNPQHSNLLSVQPGALFTNALRNYQAQINNQGNLTVGKNLLFNADNINLSGQLRAKGNLTLQANNSISINKGVLSTATSGKKNAGNILITTNTLDILNDSSLSANTNGKGNAGTIKIKATDLVSFDKSSAFTQVTSEAVGNAGDIDITTGSLSLTNGSSLSASTFGKGNAGTMKIKATDTVKFDGSSAFSRVGQGAVGNAGGIDITTGSLSLTNGARLNASTSGTGDAGSIDIHATKDVLFDGVNGLPTAALTNVEEGAKGNAGNVNITAESLSVTNGALLESRTRGTGNAGTIKINATDLVSFDKSSALSRVESGAVGKGGDIDITTGSLSLTNEARLSASSSGQGNAGTIKIKATDTVSFDGDSAAFSQLGSEAVGKGGDIDITTGSLSLTNDAQLTVTTFGKGDAGTVKIKATDTVKFDGDSAAFSRVGQGAVGNAGGIDITTGSLSLTNGARLNASTSGTGDAGSININATNNVLLDGVNGLPTAALTNVEEGAKGNAGNVNITANSLSVTNGALLESRTRGTGNAGTIKINATDLVSFDKSSAFSTVESGAVGKGGDIDITTGSLSLTNEARLSASSSGQGNAGTVKIKATDTVKFDGSYATSQVTSRGNGNAGGIDITTGSLSVTNGAQLSATTFGTGDAGTVKIKATDTVKFDGVSNGFSSGAFSQVTSGAVGKGGDIDITTGSLSLTNDARLSASSNGEGDAGTIKVNATGEVKFDSNSRAVSQLGLGAVGNAGGIDITTGSLSVINGAQLSATTFGTGDAGTVKIKATDIVSFNRGSAFSTVGLGAVGNAGGIDITAGSLSVTNGARLNASTRGKGDAGSIDIHATKDVLFDSVNGSTSALTNVEEGAKGNAGNVNITAESLSVTNGALLESRTRGNGNAGSVNINATKDVLFDGNNRLFNSGAFIGVEATAQGSGGNIDITAETVTVKNNAQISASTLGQGDAGSITVKANTFTAANGGQLLSTTSNAAKAGNINLTIRDHITLTGTNTGLFANTEKGSSGDSGSIFIDPQTLIIQDGAKIAVNSQGSGKGGNISLQAGNLTLDNNAFITAETSSSQGGEINLQIQDLLLLRRNSQITATAGTAGAGGDGGNIKINSPLIVAFPNENSDITANAFQGNGGKININTNAIFGLKYQPQITTRSDITASSQFGLAGQIQINTPDVDPTSGLIELPENLLDAESLVGTDICSDKQIAKNNSFVITGKGGVPADSDEYISNSPGLVVWATRSKNQEIIPMVKRQQQRINNPPQNSTKRVIQQAQGWIIGADGKIILTAEAPNVTPQISALNHPDCHANSTN
ncbi:beta strand repeat-containing protein [Anabaena catenula]|uniref:S-layer family protein n=1 Tax=Anabaena catenula FACHB-362 TaxID=2692877 RepID=A0ABR8J3R6_9NOST|nr:S-layer family protein [Anabaena catenula]MBD2692308.1 S-layer family protein [Anabaena catenula FACHB-362]